MRILKIAIPQNFQKRNQIIDTKNMPAWDQQNIQRIGFIRSIGIFIFWEILPRLLVPGKR